MTDLRATRGTESPPETAPEPDARLADILHGHLAAARAQLCAAHAAGDWIVLQDVAHRLNGAAAYCEVPELRDALTALETAARRQQDASDISARCTAVCSAIDALLGDDTDTGPDASAADGTVDD